METIHTAVENGRIKLDIATELPEGSTILLKIIPTEIPEVNNTNGNSKLAKQAKEQQTSSRELQFTDSSSFGTFGLSEPLLRAVKKEGYKVPSLIQAEALPLALESHDILGCAQTGSGKTAAFALPMLQHLAKRKSNGKVRGLVLAPTRELAAQIGESIDAYGTFTNIKQVTIFGGVNQFHQVKRLKKGADIIVATPGRLLDLMGQNIIHLGVIEILVLDEADRMLDMGFIHDVNRIVKAIPKNRQTMLFSATMPQAIRSLANRILQDPKQVAVNPVASTVDTVKQFVYHVDKKNKLDLLIELLQDGDMIRKALIFTRTKYGANKLSKKLQNAGYQASAIHGNKSQSAREKALSQFKENKINFLVATDIAARGIDIDDISHVINFEVSNEPETYVHRIGRTARAGALGVAISLCDPSESKFIQDIQRLTRIEITEVKDHPFPSTLPDVPMATAEYRPRRGNFSNSRRGNRKSRRR
ncbi:MAG: DEAD/DEAH box helicase [Candidatus Kariarchaeaceae archaeon]|jgi:ATP-dependent RNA helicase RhlE